MDTTATMTFYEYVQKTKEKSKLRKLLAEYLERICRSYPKVKIIDSFGDVAEIGFRFFYDNDTVQSFRGSSNKIASGIRREFSEDLWVEYCTACDHPL